MSSRTDQAHNWVNSLFRLRRWPIPVVAIGLALFIFASGLCIAATTQFAPAYWRSLPVYLACISTGWVTACVRWGLENLPTVVDDLKVCMPYEDFEVLVKQWMRRFASQAGMALCAVILFALGATLLYLGMFGLTDPASAKHVFSPEWYKGNLHQRILLMYYLGAWCALAGGAGAWLFLVNIPFLFKLGRIRAVPMPTVLLAQFRSASDFYLMGTTAWFVAVAMAVLLIFRNISATAIAFLIVCGVIGLSAFLFPQFIFHKFLVRAQSHIATIALDEYNSTSSIAIPTAGVASDLQRLATLSDLTQPGPMWVYDLTDVAVFLISNSIAPLALAAKAFAASYISSLVSH